MRCTVSLRAPGIQRTMQVPLPTSWSGRAVGEVGKGCETRRRADEKVDESGRVVDSSGGPADGEERFCGTLRATRWPDQEALTPCKVSRATNPRSSTLATGCSLLSPLPALLSS